MVRMAASSWQVVLISCRYEPKIIPFLLAALRILICLLPQTGYLHPDEFFQSSDIVGGRHFNSRHYASWEFTTDRPIRCMFLPTLLNKIAFGLATSLQTDPSAYLLLVAPRLIYTITSFIVDFSLYKLCQYYSSRGLWYLPVSIVFQTSFICLGCLTRTLSNVPEVIIFSLILLVVGHLIRPRFRVVLVTPTRSTPAHERVKASTQLSSSLLVGLLVTLGTFNRPTFPCFALVPMLYWLNESFKRNSYNIRLNIQRVLVPVAISSTLTAILLSTYDTVYYKDSKILEDLFRQLVQLKFKESYEIIQNNWVVTPYYFVKYNTNVDNLSRYGLHAPYMHMLVNVPFAFGPLGLMFYGKLINLMTGSGVYRLLFSAHRIYALMLLTVLTSIILLSFIPHQEFRFLMPLIVPLVYAFAFNIYARNKWLCVWLIYNLILTYFYTSIHQAGVLKASLDLGPTLKTFARMDPKENQTLVDVHAFRCYIVPSYHWNIAEKDYRFEFNLQNSMEDFNQSIDAIETSLERRLGKHSDHAQILFFMLPSLYLNQLDEFIRQNYQANLTQIQVIKQYAPQFSFEDLAISIQHLKKNGVRHWRDASGFTLARTEIIRQVRNKL